MAGSSVGNTRFHLVTDEDLKDIISSADSKSTKNQVKYATKIFEGYLELTGTDLVTVSALPNSELDKILGKFFCSARQQNGELYCKKTMQAIRFGLQRHFLSEDKADIIMNSRRLPLSPDSIKYIPGASYSFLGVSDIDLSDVVGLYFEWEYDAAWYKPWEWDLFIDPEIYVHKMIVSTVQDPQTYIMCGPEDPIEAEKDVVAFFPVNKCR